VLRLVAYLWLGALGAIAADGSLRGVVRDARTGEPLARVAAQLAGESRQTLTGDDGSFDFGAVAAGEHVVNVATVGYRLSQTKTAVGDGERIELDVTLTPDVMARRDRVEVRSDAFDLTRDGGPTAFAIDGGEAKHLATVLADDPLRAAQSLPGVSSNDDFDSRFSVHGAPYSRVGLYLDGILLHMPFHTVQGEGPTGSMTVFQADVVDQMSLETEGYGPRFEDRTAGALDVRTRDGSGSQRSVRVTAGAADAGALAEGPLGRRGSWLAGVRKSYLQYLVKQSGDEPTLAFGFVDSQAQATWGLGAGSTLRVKLVDGTSDFDRSEWRDRLALNTSMKNAYRFTVANIGWEWAPGGGFVMSTHGAYLRERYDDTNRDTRALSEGFYGEWVAKTDVAWSWARPATLAFGAEARRVRADGFSDYYFDAAQHTRVEGYRGTELLAGGYAQQSWSGWGKRVNLSAGARWDGRRGGAGTAVSPQASMAVLPWRSTRVQVSWGQYAQFPEIAAWGSVYGSPRLRPERATHVAVALEQRLGAMTRLRVTAYRRNDRDLLFRPWLEARLAGGAIVPDRFDAPIENSVGGRAEGVEFFVQRRTANRLTGWVSYALGWTRQRDGVSGARFVADQDQRHTVNAWVGYRVRPSVNLGARWTYGSGFPVPGYFQRSGDGWGLAEIRNGARVGPYQRTDVRLTKSRAFDRWKLTVYAEAVNVTNRFNQRFDSYNGYDAAGRAALSFTRMFPALPSAGVMAEF
jgi:hypothetical protein